MKYREKLSDPRWQKLRLKVFERDGFKCVSCQSSDRTLHVHHKSYHRNPWDSCLDDLATVCEDCHSNIEHAIKQVRENPELGAIPHIVNRALMVSERNPNWLANILSFEIRLCEMKKD